MEFFLRISAREYVKKQNCILSGRRPPPQAVCGHSDFMQLFLAWINLYMFLKQEKPEMDDFERK